MPGGVAGECQREHENRPNNPAAASRGNSVLARRRSIRNITSRTTITAPIRAGTRKQRLGEVVLIFEALDQKKRGATEAVATEAATQ